MSIKYVILIAAILLTIGGAGYFYQEAKYNALIDDMKEHLEEDKKRAAKKQDSIVKKRDQIITDLKSENEKAKQQSQYWYREAKRRDRNPDYSIDFLTAADEIAKSRYKPGG